MSRLKFLFDEEEKKEEKPGWLHRTADIGELPRLPASTKLKFTSDITGDIGLGISAKATGGITLPEPTQPKPIIEGLPMSKPGGKKTLLEQIGVKKPTTPEELKMGIETSMGTWEEQKKANLELQKTEDMAMEVLSITDQNERIATIQEALTGTPKEQTLQDIQNNLIKYGSINPPKNWKKSWEEGKLKTIFVGPSDKYSKATNMLKAFEDISFKKENPGLDKLSSIGWKGFTLLMGSQALAGAIEITPNLWKRLSVKVTEKPISYEEGKEAIFKTGYSEGTPYQRQIFDEAVKQADIKNISIMDALKKGISLTDIKPRFAFAGSTLYSTPVNEMVKVMAETGKILPDIAKELSLANPELVSKVIIDLSIASPAIASKLAPELVKLIPQEKPTPAKVTPPVEPKEVLKAEGEEPITKDQYNELKKYYESINEIPHPFMIKSTGYGNKNDTYEKYEMLTSDVLSTLTDLYNETIVKNQSTVPATIAEAKEILKVDPKKPTQPKELLAKQMVANKVSFADIEAVKGEKIDVSKPKDILIALRDIKAVKEVATAEPTPKAIPEELEGLAEAKKINNKVIKEYGITDIDESIGYITREGKGIDSSGIKQGSSSQGRNIDHREMAQFGLSEEVSETGTQAMQIFMNKTGDIRVVGAKEEVNIDVPINVGMPTIPQINKIRQLAKDKIIFYDFTDITGNSIKSGEGTFNNFLNDLRDTIKSEQGIGEDLSTGKLPKKLDPLVEFIYKHKLSKEEFSGARYNRDNPLNPEFIRAMEKTGIGVGKVWKDFGFNSPQDFYDKVNPTFTQATAGVEAEGKAEAAIPATEQPSPVAPVAEKATTAPAKAEVKTELIKPPVPPSPPTTQQKAEEPMGDPVAKLNELIKQAKPKRGRLETEYTKERARRIAEVERVIDEIGGEQGYIAALSKLKGQLAPGFKFAFEPVKDKLSKPEIDSLYNRTFKHPYLDEWEKISAANELTKILSGELPTPKGLILLEEIYGTDLIKSILAKRALGLKVTDFLIDVANIPRAILATADMSGFLRQGVVYVASHPVIAANAMGKTFKFAFNSKSFEQYFKDIQKDKLYPLMRKSELAITDPSKFSVSGREEAFMSRLLQKIPIIGHIIRFSERSYVGFLTKLRVDVFKTFADEFLSKGYSPVKDRKLFKDTAEAVNTFTGRGNLGSLNRITPLLNTTFFSSRLIMARFNALNPIWYARQSKPIRAKALGDFAKFVAAGITLLVIIEASGLGDVETDPRSSDFGKIRIGNTRWDIWGGFQQWCRVFAQFVSGQRKNTATGEIISLSKEEYPFTTRKEVVLRFIEGKLAPVPALINELISGAKTFEGEDITFETVVKEKFIPMYIQDIADAYMDGGLGRAVGAGTTAFFGVGVQTWQEKGRKEPLKITISKGDKLEFLKPKLNIKSTKLKFTF